MKILNCKPIYFGCSQWHTFLMHNGRHSPKHLHCHTPWLSHHRRDSYIDMHTAAPLHVLLVVNSTHQLVVKGYLHWEFEVVRGKKSIYM